MTFIIFLVLCFEPLIFSGRKYDEVIKFFPLGKSMKSLAGNIERPWKCFYHNIFAAVLVDILSFSE